MFILPGRLRLTHSEFGQAAIAQIGMCQQGLPSRVLSNHLEQ